VVIQFKQLIFFEKEMKKKIKNKFKIEKYMTYVDGKNRRRNQSMPTVYLRRQLFSLSQRYPMPWGYVDGGCQHCLCRRHFRAISTTFQGYVDFWPSV
jgi:hypothetical protein